MSYDDDAEITLNYNGEQKKIDFDWDYNDLIKKSKKNLSLTKTKS